MDQDSMDMGMDMSMISATLPYTIELLYAAYLCAFVCTAILFLTLRYHLVHLLQRVDTPEGSDQNPSPASSPSASAPSTISPFRLRNSQRTAERLLRINSYLTNKLSYTPYIGPLFLPAVGTILLGLVFTSIIATVLLLNADLILNPNRAGFLALTTVPFSIALANKNSIITALTGISHEKLNRLHRWMATATVILATVHMSLWIDQWRPFVWFLNLQLESTKVIYGLATYSTLCLLFLLSLPPIRYRLFRFFAFLHRLLALLFLILVCLHTAYAPRFILTGLLLLLLDNLISYSIKTHLSRARISILPARCTRLTLACDLSPRAGHHVYVLVPAVSWWQWHPFTVSAILPGGKTGGGAFTVHAQAVGRFTERLYALKDGTECLAIVAGPYGVPPRVDTYGAVLLVAGGSGATFTMGLLKEMMRSVERGGVTKRVEFVWCISGQAQLAWFRKDLDTALLSTMDTNFSLTIRIFIREEGDDGPVDIGECFQSSGPLKSFDCDPRVQLVTGRARAEDVLRGFVGDCAAGEGVCVVACGPSSLVADVSNAVARTSSLSGPRIDLHCERYSL